MSGRWLLLRRASALWAIPGAAVRHVHRRGDGAEVELLDRTWLRAERLEEVAGDLRRRSFPSCVSGDPCGVAELAVWRGEPVLCVDPARALPAVLVSPKPINELLAEGGVETPDA